VDGRAIGFVQIIDPALEDSHYWGDVEPLLRGLGVQGAPAGPLPPQRGTPELRAIDIWLGPPDAVGRGFGSGIMSQAIERCFAPPQVVAIVIDPLVTNTRSHRFYERFGFTPVGPRRFGQDDCLVYRLTKQRWLARAERHEEHIA
jgi:aminoglycoside 6'-N-acetyltransferase